MNNDDHPGGQATRAYWQSLAQWLSLEDGADATGSDGERVDRRSLLKLLGASMALAGAAGCDRERPEKILPYAVTPPETTPGIPQTYATAMELDGFATGVLVRSHDGRPSKIEGNPDHPASLGAAGVYEQASVLGLYDPSRARAPRRSQNPIGFDDFAAHFSAERGDAGSRLRFLLEPTGSPLIDTLLRRVQQRFPEARFTFDSPVRTSHGEEGARTVFGVPIQPVYDFGRASTILAVDADFLDGMPFSLRYARQFASRRRTSYPSQEMNRLYVIESMMTPTGAIADHRISRKPSEIGAMLGAVAAELATILGQRFPSGSGGALAGLRSDRDAALAAAIARDLARRPEASVIVVGDGQPTEVHAIAAWINMAVLRSEAFAAIAPTTIGSDLPTQSLADLLREIGERRVDTLVILGGNPVYTAPADLEMGRRVAQVDETIYLGAYENETAARVDWFLPSAHYLESWGDARAYDGTLSIVQPVIAPLFAGRTAVEVLAVFAGERIPAPLALLRDAWNRTAPGADFDAFWQDVLARGTVDGSAATPLELTPNATGVVRAATALAALRARAPSLEIAFRPDPGVFDGRYANNAWLQEFPRPLTKLTWDNAALVSPATAERFGLATEDVIELRRGGRALRVPVLVAPGHADDAFTVHLGFGREGTESVARGVGANANVLRTSDALAFADAIDVRKIPGATHRLAVTQLEKSTVGRPVAISATLAAWRADPELTSDELGPLPSFFGPKPDQGQQWAMSIDTSLCTGCGSCVLGCQSENNVFVVGKEQVLRRREMHWLRIDTYFSGPPEAPEVVQEPMLCQHCEKAPCEYVCPVNATVHSPDGLNEMVYNRCVGTRFCSNNCPYKVRRFNWFDWVDKQPANQGLVRLQRNPDVTVRERGVMEKCTYCVQRIRGAEIRARNEQRPIRTGEVMTACQQACPTRAIQFDSLDHPDSEMVAWRKEPRAFAVLHDLGTVPRTLYLARIRNTNPEMPT